MKISKISWESDLEVMRGLVIVTDENSKANVQVDFVCQPPYENGEHPSIPEQLKTTEDALVEALNEVKRMIKRMT